eukprot:413924-Lingulodinium_polyedra.AAC.1
MFCSADLRAFPSAEARASRLSHASVRANLRVAELQGILRDQGCHAEVMTERARCLEVEEVTA